MAMLTLCAEIATHDYGKLVLQEHWTVLVTRPSCLQPFTAGWHAIAGVTFRGARLLLALRRCPKTVITCKSG
jgi:hypothetical protein